MNRTIPLDERGSIPIMVGVAVITSLLIAAMLATVDAGTRTSRRAGDSANALQVADAAINDAVRRVGTAAPVACGSLLCFTRTGTVGAGGTYTYTASRPPGNDLVWDVDAVGRDASGLRRHIRAQAVGEPLFARPIFIRASANFGGGVILDSYKDEAARCTRNGNFGSNAPGSVTWPSSSSSGNCRGTTWGYPVDGCRAYTDDQSLLGSTTFPANFVPTGNGGCPPPPNTKWVVPKFNAPRVREPAWSATLPSPRNTYNVPADATPTTPGDTFTCNASTPFLAGHGYYFDTVFLAHGCHIDFTTAPATPTGPVRVYATTINLGETSGPSQNVINRPKAGVVPPGGDPLAPVACSGSFSSNLSTSVGSYCPRWTSTLELNILSGGTLQINKSNLSFWGLINAPHSTININKPGLEFWGGLVANSATASSQFTWHYDDNLTSISTGRYVVKNWREEPLAP